MNILEILKQKKREYIRKHSFVDYYPPFPQEELIDKINKERKKEDTVNLEELFSDPEEYERFMNKGVVGVVDYEQDDDTCDKQ